MLIVAARPVGMGSHARLLKNLPNFQPGAPEIGEEDCAKSIEKAPLAFGIKFIKCDDL